MHRIVVALVALCFSFGSLRAQSTVAPVSGAQALKVGDAVRVGISREPALSGDFPVDEEGYVSLPLVGRWPATAMNWVTLRDSVLATYRRELRSESITLIPLRRVYVLGAVLRPGVYMLDPTFGLEGAISLAGGAGLDGNIENIRVQRDGQVILKRTALNTPTTVYDVRSGDQLFVERRSWFDRNSTLLLTSVISLAGIVVTLASRN